MKIWDFIKNNSLFIILMPVAILLSFIIVRLQLWNYLEPTIAMITFVAALIVWWQTRKTVSAKFEGKKGMMVIGLEVGRPVTKAAKEHFGDPDNIKNPYDLIVIEVSQVIGKNELNTDEDYEKIARAVYTKIANNANKEIHLLLSGPVALSFLIGQMVGLNKFDVTIYQFYPSIGYVKIPSPSRDWLAFRDS